MRLVMHERHLSREVQITWEGWDGVIHTFLYFAVVSQSVETIEFSAPGC